MGPQNLTWNGETAIILAHGASQAMDSFFMNYFNAKLTTHRLLTAKFNFDCIEQKRKIQSWIRTLQLRASF